MFQSKFRPLRAAIVKVAQQDTSVSVSMDTVRQNMRRYTILDPHALLIESTRLDRSERIWQNIFVTVPVFSFAIVLALPISIAYAATLYQSSSES